MPMLKSQFCLLLAMTAALCGCNKQVQVNTEKIDVLTRKMFAVQQDQSKQLAEIQAQLAALAARQNKTAADYFASNQERALFYHTNTLYFLLTVDKKIQAEFQLAQAAGNTAGDRAFFYHTNELDTLYFCTTQIANALAAQEKRLTDSLKTETGQLDAAMASQKNAATADHAETLKRIQAIEASLAQVQTALGQLQVQLGKLSAPATPPAGAAP